MCAKKKKKMRPVLVILNHPKADYAGKDILSCERRLKLILSLNCRLKPTRPKPTRLKPTKEEHKSTLQQLPSAREESAGPEAKAETATDFDSKKTRAAGATAATGMGVMGLGHGG